MDKQEGNFPVATLPIDSHDGLYMDATEAKSLGDLFSEDYAHAQPFPHIVIDGILPEALLDKILQDFPAVVRETDKVYNIGYGGEHKRQILPEECPRFSRELFWFFNSKSVIEFLEGLTGIQGLLPDPHFSGGGYHETTRGGLLGVHADFRINETLHVQRRLNMLIYLNPDWEDAWLGQLELWSRDMKQCVKKVSPILNRCVVFSTEADTWHGHPDPLAVPEGVGRRSIALYYYTASQSIYDETPNHSTMYMARPEDSKEIKAEARSFRFNEHMRDWLPPVALRGFNRIKRVVGRLST